MTANETCVTDTDLTPNALLVIATLAALNGGWRTASAKTDDIGYAISKNAAWVRRHAKAFAVEKFTSQEEGYLSLSVNGHCSLTNRGHEIAKKLLSEQPTKEPRSTCPECARKAAAPVFGGYQLYECGSVFAWCPDHVPGLDKFELSPRSAKSHHTGIWYRAAICADNSGGYWSMWSSSQKPNQSKTVDGTDIVVGALVHLSRGSRYYHQKRAVSGTVLAAANRTVLVEWPDGSIDIHRGIDLLAPGRFDTGGLTDYQLDVVKAISAGEMNIEIQDGDWSGRFRNRQVPPATVAILNERGFHEHFCD